MGESHVLFDVSERIATITLNRPDAMNAFGGTMREDLLRYLEAAHVDPDVRCIVITGAGRAFCAGGDIAGMAELQMRHDADTIRQRVVIANRVVTLLRECAKPVIAAVNGAAAGGGMNLALACDLRYCTASAKFAQSFVKIGLIPDWGGHYLLPRLIGTARALELMWLGDRIDAPTALALGIVNAVFADDVFRAEVRARAQRLASGPPAALALIKRGVYAGMRGELAETLAFEGHTQPEIFLNADAREGMRAFLDKRAPQFGRDSGGEENTES